MIRGTTPFHLRSLFFGLVAFSLTGCSVEWSHLRVIRGNYNVSRGEYQRAIVDYLRAGDDGTFEPWIAYNLGNVYHYLGEAEAALDRWSVAENADVPDLVFGVAFNRGVYFLEQGRYEEALREFRSALKIDPTNIDAKTNFEIALERLEAREGLDRDIEKVERESAPSEENGGSESTATRMLDYIRRKEEQQWRANTEEAPQSEELDW